MFCLAVDSSCVTLRRHNHHGWPHWALGTAHINANLPYSIQYYLSRSYTHGNIQRRKCMHLVLVCTHTRTNFSNIHICSKCTKTGENVLNACLYNLKFKGTYTLTHATSLTPPCWAVKTNCSKYGICLLIKHSHSSKLCLACRATAVILTVGRAVCPGDLS